MNDLLRLIQERQSMRVPFDPNRQVAREDLKKILEAARWAPTPHNMQNFQIIVIDDKSVIETLGRIESRITETFLQENFEQLSFSKEELLQKKVGILSSAFPASWRDPTQFSKIAKESPTMLLRDAIAGSPLLLIVIYDMRRRAPDSEGDILGLVSLGCIMENMWLMATSLGISVRLLSDFGDRGVEEKVKRVLSIPEHMRAVYGLRLGYPVTQPPKGLRVRRDIGDFTYQNHYGLKGFE